MNERRCALVFLVAVVALAFSACGDGGSEKGGTSGTGGGSGAAGAGGSGASSGGSAGSSGSSGSSGSGTGGSAATDGGTLAVLSCQAVNENPGSLQPVELTAAQTAEAFGYVTSHIQSVWENDPQADAEKVRAAIQGAPHVFDTGIATDCTVWMRLTDGTPLSLYRKERASFAPGDPDPLDQPPPPVPDTGTPTQFFAEAPKVYELPESEKAVIGQAYNFSTPILSVVEGALNKRGYKVDPPDTSFLLADLRTGVQNAGVFWISSHGFVCPDKAGTMHYCVATDDPFDPTTGACTDPNPAVCAANRADNAVNRIGFGLGRVPGTGGVVTFHASLGFNDTFVDSNFTFAKHSLVVIDSCNSMDIVTTTTDDAGTSTTYTGLFRATLVKKGAGTVLGWVGAVEAGFSMRTMAFFFDRVLGGHGTAPGLSPLNPPQRPFSTGEVYSWMASKNRILDPSVPGTYLSLYQVAEDTILAPSIRNMEIGDPTQSTVATEKKAGTELNVFGEFGTRAVVVKVNGVAATPTGASDSKKLVVSLTPNEAAGPISIEVKTGAKTFTSNEAPLTKWSGTGRWKVIYSGSLGTPGPFNQLNCSNLYLRADVHAFRMLPEETALPGSVDASGARANQVGMRNSMADTVCVGSVGGTGTQFGTIQFVLEDKTVSIPWVENIASAIPAKPNPNFIVTAIINTTDPQSMKIVFPAENHMYTKLTQIPPAPAPQQVVNDYPSTMVGAFWTSQPIVIDGSYSIIQPTKQVPPFLGDPGELEINLTASSPPTSNTEG